MVKKLFDLPGNTKQSLSLYISLRKSLQFMTPNQRATEFAVYCIENTAARLGCLGYDVFRELQRTGSIESFLFASYSTLHTQGKDYIVNEVLEEIQGMS